MSNTVDRRELQMKFDSKEFEKNVERTCESLERLKRDLNFDDEAEGFEKVEKASKNLDMSPVEKSLERVTVKFDAFEAVAFSVCNRLTNKILDLGERIVKSLSIDNVTQGWARYEQQLKSVQSLMAAMKADVNTISEERVVMDQVGDTLEIISEYTDETSHSLTEMTAGISKFVAKGAELDTAATAVMGIANWASLAGQNASTASRMYEQLSQVMGSYVKLQDWNSVKNAGMNLVGVEKLIMEVASEAGESWDATLKKTEDGKYYVKNIKSTTDSIGNTWIKASDALSKSVEVTVDNFDQTLTSGQWFTDDILVEVLRRLGEYGDKLFKVRSEWQEILGEEYGESAFSVTKIKNSVNAINEVKAQYKELMGITGDLTEEQENIFHEEWADEIKNALSNVDNGLEATDELLNVVMDDLYELSSDRMNLSRNAFNKAYEATTLSEAVEAVKTAAKTQWSYIYQTIFGDYQEARDRFTNLADKLYEVFIDPLYALRDAFEQWKATGFQDVLFDSLSNIVEAIESFSTPIRNAFVNAFGWGEDSVYSILVKMTEGFNRFTKRLILSENASKLFEKLWTVIFKVINAAYKIIEMVWPLLETVIDLILDGIDAIAEITNQLLDGNAAMLKSVDIGGALAIVYERLKPIIDVLGEGLKIIAGIVYEIIRAFGSLIETLKDSGALDSIASSIGNLVKGLTDALTSILPSVTSFFTEGIAPAATSAMKWVKSLFSETTESVKESGNATVEEVEAVGDALKKEDIIGEYATTLSLTKDPILVSPGAAVDVETARKNREELYNSLENESVKALEETEEKAATVGERLKAIASETVISILTLVKSTADSINQLIQNLGTTNIAAMIKLAFLTFTLIVVTLTDSVIKLTDALVSMISPLYLLLGLIMGPIIAAVIAVIKIISALGSTISSLILKLKNGGVISFGNGSAFQTLTLMVLSLAAFFYGLSKVLETSAQIGDETVVHFLHLIGAFLAICLAGVAAIVYFSRTENTITRSLGKTTLGKGGFGTEGGSLTTTSDDAGGFFAAAPLLAIAAIMFSIGNIIGALQPVLLFNDSAKKIEQLEEMLKTLTGFIGHILGILMVYAGFNRLLNEYDKKKYSDSEKEEKLANPFSGMFTMLLGISLFILNIIPLMGIAAFMSSEQIEKFSNLMLIIEAFLTVLIAMLTIFAGLTKNIDKTEGKKNIVSLKGNNLIELALAIGIIISTCSVMFLALSHLAGMNMSVGEGIGYIAMLDAIIGTAVLALLVLSKYGGVQEVNSKSKWEMTTKTSNSFMSASVAITILIMSVTAFLHGIYELTSDLKANDKVTVVDIITLIGVAVGVILSIAGTLEIMAQIEKRTSKLGEANGPIRTAFSITLILAALAGLMAAIVNIPFENVNYNAMKPVLESLEILLIVIAGCIGIVAMLADSSKVKFGTMTTITASFVTIIAALGILVGLILKDLGENKLTMDDVEAIVSVLGGIVLITAVLMVVMGAIAKLMSTSWYGLAAFGMFEALMGTIAVMLLVYSAMISSISDFLHAIKELSAVSFAEIVLTISSVVASANMLNEIHIDGATKDSMESISDFVKSIGEIKSGVVENFKMIAEAFEKIVSGVVQMQALTQAKDELSSKLNEIIDVYRNFLTTIRDLFTGDNALTPESIELAGGSATIMANLTTITDMFAGSQAEIDEYKNSLYSILSSLGAIIVTLPQFYNALNSASTIVPEYSHLEYLLGQFSKNLEMLFKSDMDLRVLLNFTHDVADIFSAIAQSEGPNLLERMAISLESIMNAINKIDVSKVERLTALLDRYTSGGGADQSYMQSLYDQIIDAMNPILNELNPALGTDLATVNANSGAVVNQTPSAVGNSAIAAGNTTNYYETEININGGDTQDVYDAVEDAMTNAKQNNNMSTGKVGAFYGTPKVIPTYSV